MAPKTRPVRVPKPQIHGKLAAILGALGAIPKGHENVDAGFRFRSIDDIFNALHDLLAQHRIYVRPEMLDQIQQERRVAGGAVLLHSRVRMRHHFTAEDGSSVYTEIWGEAADSSDKSIGQAAAYAYKVALCQMFMIRTADAADPDFRKQIWAPDAADGPPRQGGQVRTQRRPEATAEPRWIDRIQAANLADLKVIEDAIAARQQSGDMSESFARGLLGAVASRQKKLTQDQAQITEESAS